MGTKLVVAASVALVLAVGLFVSYSLRQPDGAILEGTRPAELATLAPNEPPANTETAAPPTTSNVPPVPVAKAAPKKVKKNRGKRLHSSGKKATTLVGAPPVAPRTALNNNSSPSPVPNTPRYLAYEDANGQTRALVYATPEPPGSHGFSASAEAGQMGGFENGDRSFTEFWLQGGFKFNRYHEIGFGQEAKKLYTIAASGEKEFLPSDTVLYYRGLLSDNFAGFDWKFNASATLPVSQYSSDVKRITRTMVGLEVSQKYFGQRLALNYQPAFSYYFNTYGTNGAGVPLQKMAFAQMVTAKFDILPELLSLSAWGQGFVYFYEQYDTSSSSPAPTTAYQYGSYLAVDFTKFVELQAGYVRGNTLVPDFRFDDYFYDSPTARYYAALKVGF